MSNAFEYRPKFVDIRVKRGAKKEQEPAEPVKNTRKGKAK